MANSENTKDILKNVLQACGEVTDGSSELHQVALLYINRVYKNVLAASNVFDVDIGEPWTWARARDKRSLILEPSYSDGTVSLTNGLTAGTFSTPPAASQKDRWLKVPDQPTYYQIAAHTGGAGPFTIDAPYLEPTSGALGFESIPIIYDLGPQILRLVEPFRVYQDNGNDFLFGDEDREGKIYSVDITTLRREWPLKFLVQRSTPTRFAIKFRSDTEFLIEFNGYPDSQIKVDLDLIDIPAPLTDDTNSIPIIPIESRDVLTYGASFFLLEDKEDDKAQVFFALAKSELKKLLEAEKRSVTHTTKNKGKLLPRQERLSRRRRIFLS